MKSKIAPAEQWRRFLIPAGPYSLICIGLYVKEPVHPAPEPLPLPPYSSLLLPNFTYDVPRSCPSRVPGFVYYPAADYNTMYPIASGATYIQYVGTTFNYSINSLAEACLREPSCKSFTDWSYLYLDPVPAGSKWPRMKPNSWIADGVCTGLYVRATESPFGELTCPCMGHPCIVLESLQHDMTDYTAHCPRSKPACTCNSCGPCVLLQAVRNSMGTHSIQSSTPRTAPTAGCRTRGCLNWWMPATVQVNVRASQHGVT